MALAEHELTLVQSGSTEELEAIHTSRLQLLTALGARGSAPLTAADKDTLQQAARLQMLAREAMRQRQDELTQDLAQSTVARRATEG